MTIADRFAVATSDAGRYHLLVDAITDYAIYMLDGSGCVTSWSRGARRFKGYDEAEVLGKHFSIFYTEDDRLAGLPARALARERSKAKAGGYAGMAPDSGPTSSLIPSVMMQGT